MAAVLGDATVGRLIDIGTGTGRMLELFGGRADRRSASTAVVRDAAAGAAKLSERGLANAELRQADLYALPLADGAADAAILHHVLHFAQTARRGDRRGGARAGAGGRLLIADFAPHDREELRDRDAHARLAFRDEQIAGWFAAAGLAPARTETSGGRRADGEIVAGRKRSGARRARWWRRHDGVGRSDGRGAARAGDAAVRRPGGRRRRVSFEFFPPKTEKMEETLWESVQTLAPLGPRFVSVTYGAGGTTRERTHATVARIARETAIPAAAHLTCVEATREEIDAVAREYWDAGVRHIVALRGDPPRAGAKFAPHPGGYENAAALVAGLKQARTRSRFRSRPIPNAIPDSRDAGRTISTISSASSTPARRRAITQFFHEAETFFRFRDAAAAAGIDAEIVPGIMPVMNFASVAAHVGDVRHRRCRRGWGGCSTGSTIIPPRASWSPRRSPPNCAAGSMRAGCAISISTRSTAPS